MRGEANGIFLIRFEKQPSLFALHFILNGQLRNILIDTLWTGTNTGYRIREDKQENSKVFQTLQQLIQHYQFCLKVPRKRNVTFEK